MQQIYQQQMEAQANHTINNEEKKSSGIEIPDLSTLNLENVDHAAALANNNDLVITTTVLELVFELSVGFTKKIMYRLLTPKITVVTVLFRRKHDGI